MNIASVSPCTPIRSKSNPSFGAVIPVAILYHDIITKEPKYIIKQTSTDKCQKFFHDIMHKFTRRIGSKKESGKRIAQKFGIVDQEFARNPKIRTIRNGDYIRKNGELLPDISERCFATGGDAMSLSNPGRRIGNGSIDPEIAKIEHLDCEKDLCMDVRNRIKGVTSFIISVVPRFVNKGKPNQRIVYDVTDGYFMLKRGEYQRLTGQKPPTYKNLSEFQKKLIKLFNDAK